MKTVVNNVIGSKSLYHIVGNALNYLNSIQRKIVAIADKPTTEVEFSPVICPLTGALNRIGLRKYFDQILPSDITNVSLIFIELNYVDDHVRQFSKNVSDKNLQRFVADVIDVCGTRDLITRWSLQEFVLVCPQSSLEHAVKLANKICININNKAWAKGNAVTCIAGASQANGEDLHYLINSIKKALYKTK